MIVIDASATIELVLGTPRGALVAARLGASAETIHAPHLLDVEVAQVLRRYAASASITSREARLALDDFRSLDIARYGHEMLLPRIWELRTNVTAYDAAYLSLAELLRAPLLTCDARLARAPGHRADVETVDSAP